MIRSNEAQGRRNDEFADHWKSCSLTDKRKIERILIQENTAFIEFAAKPLRIQLSDDDYWEARNDMAINIIPALKKFDINKKAKFTSWWAYYFLDAMNRYRRAKNKQEVNEVIRKRRIGTVYGKKVDVLGKIVKINKRCKTFSELEERREEKLENIYKNFRVQDEHFEYDFDTILNKVKTLSQKEKKILRLLYVDGLTQKQTGQVIGKIIKGKKYSVTSENIRQKKNRAMEKLKRFYVKERNENG